MLRENLENLVQREVIIDFMEPLDGFSVSAKLLAQKWNSRHPNNPCIILKGEEFLQTETQLTHINGFTKIHIIGHGFAQVPLSIYSSDGEGGAAYNYGAIAKSLSSLINNEKAVVSLVCCEAGKGMDETSGKSFGALLHYQLAQFQQRDIPVLARTTLTSVTNGGHKLTADLDKERELESLYNQQAKALRENDAKTFGDLQKQIWQYQKHKQLGSKVVFSLKDGLQVRQDYYDLRWRQGVLNALERMIGKTKNTRQKDLLQKWLQDFPTKSTDEIYKTILNELKSPNSVVQNKFTFFAQMLGFDSLQEQLKAIISQRDLIIKSHHVKPDIETGNGSPINEIAQPIPNQTEEKGDSYTIGDDMIAGLMSEILPSEPEDKTPSLSNIILKL